MRQVGYHFIVLYPGIDDIPERDYRLRICLARSTHYPDRWDIVDVILPNQLFGGISGVGPGDQWKKTYHEEHRAMAVVLEGHPAHALFEFVVGAVLMRSLDERKARQMVLDTLEVGNQIGTKILSDSAVLGVDARAEARRSTR